VLRADRQVPRDPHRAIEAYDPGHQENAEGAEDDPEECLVQTFMPLLIDTVTLSLVGSGRDVAQRYCGGAAAAGRRSLC
jgi:hypothetical protein